MSSERISTLRRAAHTEPYSYPPSGNEAEASLTGGIEMAGWHTSNVAGGHDLELKERQGFERGLQEGEARAKKVSEQNLAEARDSIASALEKFKKQRDSYFNRVEAEVVQLALSIARKILHREAQMDPLLLAGMVHVALEKLDQGTRARLRAHPDEIHYWNQHFAEPAALSVCPEIIGDPALEHGECALETEIGSTQISLDTQLKEIEQGFFDLLEQRPPVR